MNWRDEKLHSNPCKKGGIYIGIEIDFEQLFHKN